MESGQTKGKPYVNPFLEGLLILIMIVSVLTVLGSLVMSWSTEGNQEDLSGFGIMLLAFVSGIAAFSYRRALTQNRDEWEYRHSLTTKEEKELQIDDTFVFSLIYRSTYRPSTYLYHYIISDGVLYQVHPFQDKKFCEDYFGIGSSIYASIIEEDDQLKIIDYKISTRVAPKEYQSSESQSTGRITEKYFGSLPFALKSRAITDFPGIVTDPRLKQDISKKIRLELDGNGLRNVENGKSDSFVLRIDHLFEIVSMEDFLKFKIGDIVSFKRNDDSGISEISKVVLE